MSKRAPVSKPKGAVRAKSGCFTCRIRRKKCDEQSNAEGACQTCVRLRIECLGFGSKRPDWMREGNSVVELRSKIKDFLAQNGMIKGHSATSSSRPQPSDSAPAAATTSSPASPSMSTPQLRASSSEASPQSIHYPELHPHDSLSGNGMSRTPAVKPVLVLSTGHLQHPTSRVHSHGSARVASDLQRPSYPSGMGSLSSMPGFSSYGRGDPLEPTHSHHGTYTQVATSSRRSSPPLLPQRRTVDLLGHAPASTLSSPSSSSQSSSSNPSSSSFSTLPLSALSPGYPHDMPLTISSPPHSNGLQRPHTRPRGHNYDRPYPDVNDGSCFSGYANADPRGITSFAMSTHRDGRDHHPYDDGYPLGLGLDLTADTSSTPLSAHADLWSLDSTNVGTTELDERSKSERMGFSYDHSYKLAVAPPPTVHVHSSDDANANPTCDRPSDLDYDAKRFGLQPPSPLHSRSPRSDAIHFGSAINSGSRAFITGPTTSTSGMTSTFNTVPDAFTGYSYHANNNSHAGYAAITSSTHWPVEYARSNGHGGSAVAQSPSPYSIASQLTPDSPMHPAHSSVVLGTPADVGFPSQSQEQSQSQTQMHPSGPSSNGYASRVAHGHVL